MRILVGPCDACSPLSGLNLVDRHALAVTACGRALCRGCDCGGNCYDRHVPSCNACIEISNREVANEMVWAAKLSMNLLPTNQGEAHEPRS